MKFLLVMNFLNFYFFFLKEISLEEGSTEDESQRSCETKWFEAQDVSEIVDG